VPIFSLGKLFYRLLGDDGILMANQLQERMALIMVNDAGLDLRISGHIIHEFTLIGSFTVYISYGVSINLGF
jgi:hypothetical protein